MKFSTIIKKLGYEISNSLSYEIYDDFETYRFQDFRLSYYYEDGYIIISKYYKLYWEVIYRRKNYIKINQNIK